MIDSGPRPGLQQFALVAPPARPDQMAAVEAQPVQIVIMPDGDPAAFRQWRREWDPAWQQTGHPVTVVRRVEGTWGNRLYFEDREVVEASLEVSPAAPDPQLTSKPAAPVEEPAQRSGQVVIIPVGDKETPVGYVELSASPNFGAEALVTARQAFLLAAGGAMLIALGVGLVVSRSLTAPLQQLIGATNRMSGGDLSARASVQGADEIGELGRRFNQMAERLETSFAELSRERDTLRRFIADASHELRTPITTLRNFNELLQGPAAADPAAREEFLQESQAQLKRLTWITDNLLNLSRLEAGLISLDLAHHDVGEILATCHAAFKALAQEKGISLSVKYPLRSLLFRCDRARFELVLSNLLDNALKFTPAGGAVEVGARQVDQAVQFWVKDNGPGIPPAEQAHIFERFYRGHHSHNTPGSGLGLAIVQRIVEAHGGQIGIESAPTMGSCFTITI
jgi:signal transduction histidine kinase